MLARESVALWFAPASWPVLFSQFFFLQGTWVRRIYILRKTQTGGRFSQMKFIQQDGFILWLFTLSHSPRCDIANLIKYLLVMPGIRSVRLMESWPKYRNRKVEHIRHIGTSSEPRMYDRWGAECGFYRSLNRGDSLKCWTSFRRKLTISGVC